MNDLTFNELLSSVKETKKIMNKQAEPSRVFIKKPNVLKIIREKLSLIREQFAKLMKWWNCQD